MRLYKINICTSLHTVAEPERPRAKSVTSLNVAIREESTFQPHGAQPTLEERRRLMKGIHRRDTPKAGAMEITRTQKGKRS